ncbi:MAG: LPS export ABC transporter permease LptF, partial [Alphaproteobacteria bacterium]|nr:LPS export ABC transporter permease LptF [Alphaproteobacteria bacterium]
MTAISRYIFRQLVIAALFVAVALTLIVSLFGSLRLVDFIINRGLPISVLFELIAFRVPGFLTIVLPVATIAAILAVYNKLLNDSELVVMRASGVSHLSVAAPGIVLALCVMAISFPLYLYVSPLMYSNFKAQQFSYRNAFGSILLQEGQFNTPSDHFTVYIRKREGPGELLGIFAHDARNPDKPVTYLAERGTATQTDQGMRVVMFNGSQQLIDRETGRLTLFYFDQYSLDIGFLNQTNEVRWIEPQERFLGGLFRPDDSANDRFYATQLIAEGHRRISAPLYILAYALVGLAALLIGDFNRRGQTGRILAAISAIVILQLVGLSLFSLSRKTLAIVPLTYALPIVTAAVMAYVLFRERRGSTGTVRDGAAAAPGGS